MSRTWQFDDFEFHVRWGDRTGEDLPVPLVITTRIQEHEAILAQARRVRADLAARPDAEIDAMFTAITKPDVVVVGWGLDSRDIEKPQAHIRVRASRTGDRAFVITQQPGETMWHAAGFTVEERNPSALAAAVVAALPETNPGRLGTVALPGPATEQSMDFTYREHRFQDRKQDSSSARTNALLTGQRGMVGRIEIAQGHSEFGPSGRMERRIHWADMVDDGRYIVNEADPGRAQALDAAALIALVNDQIEEVLLVLRDERRSLPPIPG
ncbi:MAG: hypothetical protein HOQ24_01290 [Mycobacteriaceae bacterium]|nr:hypothetical protein [Mycobacteriaceae bacterium]